VISLVNSFINRVDGKNNGDVENMLRAPLSVGLRAALTPSETHPDNRRRLGERPSQVRLSLRQLTPEFASAVREPELVITDADAASLERISACADPARTMVAFPTVYFPGTGFAMRELAMVCRDRGLKTEANCWGSLSLCREYGLPFVAGPGLPILNHLAIKCLRELGAAGVSVSMEADRIQIEDICRAAPLPLSLLIYSRPVLAYTRIPKGQLLPNADTGGGTWTDRRGISLNPESADAVTAFRSLAPFDWRTIRNSLIRVAHIAVDLSGESSPLDAWKRLHRPGGKSGFLFNYDRGLQ
jgi:hypothetical protein